MTANDLLAAVILNPHDIRRASLADAVADHLVELPNLDLRGGEVERDQWGLPWRVRCTMGAWCGEACEQCEGLGIYHRLMVMFDEPCLKCHGTGRIPGIAATVCGAWPVAEVEFSDVKPNKSYLGCWQLWNDSTTAGEFPENGDVDKLLFDLITEGKRATSFRFIDFATESAALAALSHAALTFGRRAAGLPDLQGAAKSEPSRWLKAIMP